MKRFRFQLERIVRFRANDARLARAAYGLAVRKAREAAALAAALQGSRARLEASLAGMRERLPLTAGALRVVLGAIDRLDRDIDEAKRAAREADLAAERARQDYLARRREQLGLEALRERRRAAHEAAALALEAKVLDEIARDRFLRGRVDGGREATPASDDDRARSEV